MADRVLREALINSWRRTRHTKKRPAALQILDMPRHVWEEAEGQV